MKDQTFYEAIQFTNSIPVIIIEHTRETYGPSQTHWHNDLEISLLFSGIVRCYVGGNVRDIREGQLCLVNSGDVHSTIPQFNGTDKYAPGMTVIVKYEFLKSIIRNFDSILFEIGDVRTEQRISLLLYEILDLDHCKNAANEVKILSIVCRILSILLTDCTKKRDDLSVNYWKDSERQKIILDYIHENYNQPLYQSELAEKFHFSREYFCRFFKKFTGLTFKDYLTGCRLTHAERMLHQQEITIVEIAQQTGFADEQSFIKAFKKEYGETPGKYRKQWND